MPGCCDMLLAGRIRHRMGLMVIVASSITSVLIGAPAVQAQAAVAGPRVAGVEAARTAPVPLNVVTACQVFTLAEARGLIGSAAKVDPGSSPTVDLDGQRSSQCAYSSAAEGLADTQVLIPLNSQVAKAVKVVFADNEISFKGTSLKGIGSAAFWKTKAGTPELWVLTANDVMFNIRARTNGTDSASEADLTEVALKVIEAL
jgi:hypothetical protein